MLVRSRKAAELGHLQAEGLESAQQLVERLLIGDRPVQDRLDGFGRGRQSLEHQKYRVADAAFDPDLIVGCHARPSLVRAPHGGGVSTSTIGGAIAEVLTRTR
jgi:hypothetical protein